MPHSGGGGSHSGGSHGGSHRSSGSGRRSARVSNKPFIGCRTFVIYRKNKPPKMIYSDSDYNKPVTMAQIITSILISGIFAIFIFIFMIASIIIMFDFGHEPITPPIDTEIKIIDDYGLINESDKDELMSSLIQFYKTTGVVPAVEFTTDETWNGDYLSCENFAYNEYVTNFSDEKHMLIVYSYGYVNEETGFNEFHWESMYGDELGRAVTESDETEMTSIMQRNLTVANGSDVAHAIAISFDELTVQVSDTGVHIGDLNKILTGAVLFLFGIFFLIILIGPNVTDIQKYIKQKNGQIYEVYQGMLQKSCEYCGCMYIVGTISVCPHCGAAIPAFNSGFPNMY